GDAQLDVLRLALVDSGRQGGGVQLERVVPADSAGIGTGAAAPGQRQGHEGGSGEAQASEVSHDDCSFGVGSLQASRARATLGNSSLIAIAVPNGAARFGTDRMGSHGAFTTRACARPGPVPSWDRATAGPPTPAEVRPGPAPARWNNSSARGAQSG